MCNLSEYVEQQGVKKGVKKGVRKEKQDTAKRMNRKQYSVFEIADISGLSEQDARKVIAETC